MSTISELAEAIGALADGVREQMISAANGVVSQCEDAITQAEALGSEETAEQLTEVKASLEAIVEQLNAVVAATEEAQTQAAGIGGG